VLRSAQRYSSQTPPRIDIMRIPDTERRSFYLRLIYALYTVD